MRMTLRAAYLCLTSIAMVGCVRESEYNRLQAEFEQVKQELSDLRLQNEALLEEKRRAQIERDKVPLVSESQALDFIEDNFSFYERDAKYRNVKLRRVADNSFEVALETCTKKGPFSADEFFWTSEVRTLTVSNNGKYYLH